MFGRMGFRVGCVLLCLAVTSCTEYDATASEMSGSLVGLNGCTCLIADDASTRKLVDVNVDCNTTFGDITFTYPMPLSTNVARTTRGGPVGSFTDKPDPSAGSPLAGVFTGVIELGIPREHLAPSPPDKWLYFPIHAKALIPKQRLCELGGSLFGHDCNDPAWGYNVEEGLATFDGQCEAFLTGGGTWP